MLDKNALSQLNQLKQDLHNSKERAEGTVRGSQGRYGFVRLDDKRDIFLPPDEMQKVLPGDRIAIAIITKDGGKPYGEVEKVLDSSLDTFTGRYVTRGQKAHFVEPDLPRFGRLIFLAPSERKKAQPGELIHCKLKRHPFPDGKSQAQILARIGAPDQPGIEADYTVAKFRLQRDWQDSELSCIGEDAYTDQREDLTAIDFVTIDSVETRDIDDALFAERNDKGWKLMVAVADPTAFIPEASALDRAAQQRATTVYLPGAVIPMLPEDLSSQRCSLLAEEDRAAMVCEIQVAGDGTIGEYRFTQATIRSRAKLSYSEVHAYLRGDSEPPQPVIKPLGEVFAALLAHRERHHLVMADRADYRLILNEQRKIENIVKIERNNAHRLVEECMIAANRCAADWLSDGHALFTTHAGIREDRIDNIKALLSAEMAEQLETDLQSLDGYITLQQAITTPQGKVPLQSIVNRMLQRGQLTREAGAHHGMGLDCYTTFTSPLRKYSDFMVHRCLRAKLMGQPIPPIDDATLEQLQTTLLTARQASNDMESWLKCQYLANKTELVFSAHIAHVNGGGFHVRLDDSGIEGFVDARSIPGKLSFDANYLRLSNDEQSFQLDQAIKVKVQELDEATRSIRFELAGT